MSGGDEEEDFGLVCAPCVRRLRKSSFWIRTSIRCRKEDEATGGASSSTDGKLA